MKLPKPVVLAGAIAMAAPDPELPFWGHSYWYTFMDKDAKRSSFFSCSWVSEPLPKQSIYFLMHEDGH